MLSLEPLKSFTTCNSLFVICIHNKAENMEQVQEILYL